MKLYIKETGEEKSLCLKEWDGTKWGADFFSEAECNVIDGSEVSADEYQNIVDYWECEVADHNNGDFTEQFGDYNGKELAFSHN